MTDIRLTVQGLAVDYPTARVVDNVSFTLGNERWRWWANPAPANR